MVTHNADCPRAIEYYYDFLLQEFREDIPAEIYDHIRHCSLCHHEISELKTDLEKCSTSQRFSQRNHKQINLLSRQFAYINLPVDCRIAGPFLPLLSQPGQFPSVPTPITIHLDNCPSCQENYKLLQSFNLNEKQAAQTSQLMVFRRTAKPLDCQKAKEHIQNFIKLSFKNIPPAALQHFTQCRDCRDLIQDGRRKTLLNIPERSDHFPCDQVKHADIFDYVVPDSFKPQDDDKCQFRESLLQHLRDNPRCLQKIIDFHENFYNFLEKEDSGIATTCRINHNRMDRSETIDSIYDDWPLVITVENTKYHTDKSNNLINSRPYKAIPSIAAPERRRNPLRNPLSQIAVAACLMIGFIFFYSSQQAGAVKMDKITSSVLKKPYIHVKNIRFSFILPDSSNSADAVRTQMEKIISREDNYFQIISEDLIETWDVNQHTHTVQNLKTGKTTTRQLDKRELAFYQKFIRTFSGDFPSAFGDNAHSNWQRIENESINKQNTVTAVFEMKLSGEQMSMPNLFRLFVDEEKDLPLQLDIYVRHPHDTSYQLQSRYEYYYTLTRSN